MGNSYKILVGKSRMKRQFWRPRHSSENNIKVNGEINREGED